MLRQITLGYIVVLLWWLYPLLSIHVIFLSRWCQSFTNNLGPEWGQGLLSVLEVRVEVHPSRVERAVGATQIGHSLHIGDSRCEVIRAWDHRVVNISLGWQRCLQSLVSFNYLVEGVLMVWRVGVHKRRWSEMVPERLFFLCFFAKRWLDGFSVVGLQNNCLFGLSDLLNSPHAGVWGLLFLVWNRNLLLNLLP